MVCLVLEHGSGACDLLWRVGAAIDHGVKAPSLQRAHVHIAITAHMFYPDGQISRMGTAVEHRYLMALGQRGFDHVAPNEDGTADDQQFHNDKSGLPTIR